MQKMPVPKGKENPPGTQMTNLADSMPLARS